MSAAQAAGGIGSFSIDIASDIIAATPEFSSLYGVDHSDSRSAAFFEQFVVPEDDGVVSHAQSRRDGSARQDVEYRIRRQDTGEIRWIARKGEFQHDAQGRPVRFIGIARDVTARRQSDDNLRKVQQKLALALDATGIGTFDFDLLANSLEWDDRCRELFGLPPGSQVTYETFLRGLHEEDRQRIDAEVVAALSPAGNGAYDVIYRTVGAFDGQIRWVAAKGKTYFENGKAVRLIGTVQDITQAQHEESRRRAIEERYRLAVRATNDSIWDWDFASNHVLWNEALTQAYGHELSQVEPTGEWWIDHIHPHDRSRIHASIHAAIDGTGSEWRDEYRFRRADGSYANVLDRGYVIRDEAGQAQRMIGAMLDLTRVQEAEAAVRESELRYRSLFSSLDEGFCIIEFVDGPEGPLSDYLHVEYNEAYERQAGVSGIAGKRIRDVFPQEADKWIDFYRTVLDTGLPRRLQITFDETDRVLDVAAFRMEPAERRQVAVVFQDVTARHRAERSLQELNLNLERQVEERTAERDRMWAASPDLMVILTPEGFYRRLNPAWKTLLGYEFGELEGRFGLDLVHPEDLDLARQALDTARADAPPSFDVRIRHKDGSYRWVQWVAAPGPDEIFAVGRHVTGEKEQAAALAAAETALRQSQKMEAVGQLTGGLAHDFNNLLAGISGSLEMMERRFAQGRQADVDRYLAAAMGAVKRAAGLTHRLLAFSRRQTLAPTPTNVSRLVLEMEELVQRTVGPSIEVETISHPHLWPVLVDQNQLENALLNLCINARDALPDGGQIIIEMHNRTIDNRIAATQDMAAGDYVSLSVSDNGVGIAPDIIDKVFEPFFTTKPIGVGTGLGLSMIFGFVRQSGGQIRIHSQEGKGTSVTLFLPRHTEEEVIAAAEDTMSDPHSARHGETVLVVDDEPLVRLLIVDVLEDLGYQALEAGDGPEAMKILRSDARIDLLVTDVGLPNGMNGRQVADAARDMRPGLGVLFVTGYADNAVLSHGHLEPGMQIVTKPFTVDVMTERIRSMIEAGKTS
nr:PAS domain-containing protein [Rhizobium sp. SSA_523]